jgi:hypothetical protein
VATDTGTWSDAVTGSSFQPQQVTPPVADSAHVWYQPAATATWPPAAIAAGTSVCPLALLPQQVTPPAADKAHVWMYVVATATWPDAAAEGTVV